MKYITFVHTTNATKIGQPPQALFEAITQLGIEAGARLLENGGMSDTGKVTVKASQVLTDGPYAEAKEVVAGYAIYELANDADAMDWTKRFAALHPQHWPEWEGEIIVQQMHSFTLPS